MRLASDEWNPTHVALDLIMPEMDGGEVLTVLAERRCREVAGVLAKPFSAVALRALLEDPVANSRQD